MSNDKRARGRPRGSGKNDNPYLAEVADILIREPSLKPTTAMKRVKARYIWRETDETLIRRWQAKWKERGQSFLAAARERARPRAVSLHEAIASIGRVGTIGVVEPPLLAAINWAAKDLHDAVAQTAALNQVVAQAKALQDLITPPPQFLASMKGLKFSMAPLAEFTGTMKTLQESLAPSPAFIAVMKSLEDQMRNLSAMAESWRIKLPYPLA